MEIRLSGHGAYRTEYCLVWIPRNIDGESWLADLPDKTFPGGVETNVRMLGRGEEYSAGSYSYGYDHSSEVRCK